MKKMESYFEGMIKKEREVSRKEAKSLRGPE